MSELLYARMAYCSICDQYFPNEEARQQHIQLSPRHPRCDSCDKRYATRNALRNHLVCSPRHNYCVVCERDFQTAAGLRVHMEYASVHRDDSDDDDSPESDIDSIDDHPDGWEDGLGEVLFPQGGSDEEFSSTVTEYALERASDDEALALETLIHDLSDEFSDLEQVPLEAEPDPSASEDDDDVEDEEDFAPVTNVTASESSSEMIRVGPPASPEPTRMVSVHSFTCPLCLEFPTASSATRCGHVFCSRCIQIALRTKRNCPVCRVPAFENHLRRIYLGVSI